MELQIWLTLVVKGKDVITFVVPPLANSYIGRDESANDVVLHDPQVSRMHVKLVARGEGYAVQDLHSSSGTQLNGRHVSGTTDIESGDMLQVGSYVLRVDLRQWHHAERDELATTVMNLDADTLGMLRETARATAEVKE